MNYQIFSDNEWIYPDSELDGDINTSAKLFSARGCDVCFQILTDIMISGDEHISVDFDRNGCDAIVYRLLPSRVSENSGAQIFTTKNYDEVRSFVTRKAPFDVFDLTLPLDCNYTESGRAAFFVRINVAADAPIGTEKTLLKINIGGLALALPVELKIYSATVPPLKNAGFHMINWIYYDCLARDFNVEPYSERYMNILREFLWNQLDMRNDHLMIPSGTAVRDADGRVVDFDFTAAEAVGNLALEMGFSGILGGFSVRFEHWREPYIYLLWDRSVEARSPEGYRQLKLYFTRAWECVKRNGWEDKYAQCIEDEPQLTNADAYRVVCGICRKCMPGVTIHDPVEAYTLGGGCDIWDVKQAVYEKYIDEFRALQEIGEEIWLYTCGFPAGYTMNRVADLPLTASRLTTWMCCLYGAKGFLHWGYHMHNPEGRDDICFHATEDKNYPAGNSFVVYNGDGRPWYSVRGHAQRAGAYDAELFIQLQEKDRAMADLIIKKACRSFDDYETSAKAADNARRELLEALG